MKALSRHWRSPARLPERLGLLAFTLLLLLAIALSVHTYTVLADSRTAGDGARARLMAQALAQRVDRALALGIALPRLVGVPEMLQQRLEAYPDVRSIALRDGSGRVLWKASARGGELLDTQLPLPQTSAQVFVGQGAGSVELVVRSPNLFEFMRPLALPFILGCIFFAVLAWLAAVAARASARQVRDRAVRLAQRDIAAQRYDRLTVTLRRRGFDLRAQQLARGVRGVHEMLVRTRRVIGSLRRTEPHPARREWLDNLLSRVEGAGRFADTAAPRLRRVAGAEAEAAWALLLLGGGTGAALGLSLAAALSLGVDAAVLAVALAATWLAGGCGWALARRSHAPAVLVASEGAAAIALAPWLNGFPDARQSAWGLLLCALAAGVGLGAALAAAVSARRAVRQRPDLLPLGARPWSVPAAAAIGLLALGPAWAGLCWMVAPGRAWLPLAPGGAALLAVACVWRWNCAGSPWRTPTCTDAANLATNADTGVTARTAVLLGLLAGGVGLLSWGPSWLLVADGPGSLPALAVVGAALLAGLGLALGLWQGRPGVPGAWRRANGALALAVLAFVSGAAVATLRASGILASSSPASALVWFWLTATLQLLAALALGVAIGIRLRRQRRAGVFALACSAAAGVLLVGGWIALQPALMQRLRSFAPVGESPLVQTAPAPRLTPAAKAGHGA